MKFRHKCRIKDETIESDISAEIALHNLRYRCRRWVSEVSLARCSGRLPVRAQIKRPTKCSSC